MPCYSPVIAWQGRKDKDGKRPVVWRESEADHKLLSKGLRLSCGKCVGCQLEYARQWAVRCTHEASLHDENCFLTLTYNDDNLPEGGTLVKKDFQDFMKKLRSRFPEKTIRYLHCGEYGEDLSRPHYHALLFGHDFSDKRPWRMRGQYQSYRSPTLDELWGLGFTEIGSVTPESVSYVCRYVTKKVTGADASVHYGDRVPEYITMSRRPGIGREWFNQFKSDAYPSDFLIYGRDFQKVKVPRYYDSILKDEDPEAFESLKRSRSTRLRRMSKDNDSFRLAVKEEVKRAQVRNLKRNYENGDI